MKKTYQLLALVIASAASLGTAGTPDCDKNPVCDKMPVCDKAVYECLPCVRGDLGITFNFTDLGGNALTANEDENYWSYSALLRLGGYVSSDFFFQFDAFGEIAESSGDDTYEDGYGLGAHLMKRGDGGGLGVFGGVVFTDQDNNETDSSQRYFVGGEALVYRCKTTYYGQVGFLSDDQGDDDQGLDSITDAWFVSGGVRYFPTECLMLSAGVGAAWGEMDSDVDDVEIYSWHVSAEKQLNNCLSTTVGYRGSYYDQDVENDTIDEHIFFVGFNVLFDGGTLLSRDRKSTSLTTPDFVRWVGQTGGPLE